MRVAIPNGLTPPDWVYLWSNYLEQEKGMLGEAYLLYSSNVPCDIFHRYRIFDSKAMALAFYARFIDQNTTVRRQTWRIVNRKRKRDV